MRRFRGVLPVFGVFMLCVAIGATAARVVSGQAPLPAYLWIQSSNGPVRLAGSTAGAVSVSISGYGAIIASGSKALATSAITSATCTSAQTNTATGAVSTDALTVNFRTDPTAVTGYAPSTDGMLTIIPYVTADTVNFKVCNNTAGSITPGAITINWQIVR